VHARRREEDQPRQFQQRESRSHQPHRPPCHLIRRLRQQLWRIDQRHRRRIGQGFAPPRPQNKAAGRTEGILGMDRACTSWAFRALHARIIAQKYIQRELIRISSEIQVKSYDDTMELDDLIDYAESSLFKVTEGNISKESQPIKPLLQEAIERMNIMTENSDGFVIAEKDMQLRGTGEFFGLKQHGLPELKIADLLNDLDILKLTKDTARNILNNDKLKRDEYEMLNKEVQKKFNTNFDKMSLN
jgi:hypothetical protein